MWFWIICSSKYFFCAISEYFVPKTHCEAHLMPPDADIGERWKCDKLLSPFCHVINIIYITGIDHLNQRVLFRTRLFLDKFSSFLTGTRELQHCRPSPAAVSEQLKTTAAPQQPPQPLHSALCGGVWTFGEKWNNSDSERRQMVTILTELEATADAEADLVLASGIIGTRKNDIVQTVIMTLLFYNQFPNNSNSSNSRILQSTKQTSLEGRTGMRVLAHYGFIHWGVGVGSIHQPLPTADLCVGHTGATFLMAVAL